MATHDRYDTDILKALQRIATSLDKIEKKMPDKQQTMDDEETILANGFCSKCKKASICQYKIDIRTTDDDLKIGYGIPIYIPGPNSPIECQLEFSKKED